MWIENFAEKTFLLNGYNLQFMETLEYIIQPKNQLILVWKLFLLNRVGKSTIIPHFRGKKKIF